MSSRNRWIPKGSFRLRSLRNSMEVKLPAGLVMFEGSVSEAGFGSNAWDGATSGSTLLKQLCQLFWAVDQNVWRGDAQGLGSEAIRHSTAPDAGITAGHNIN